MMSKGLLIVITNPPSDLEEEFNAWYDTEHVPERMSVPGFESARRYMSLDVPRRYLALYDMTSLNVLESPGYNAISGENNSPWTRRIVPRGRFVRIPAQQIYPGAAAGADAPRLLFLRLTTNGSQQQHLEVVQGVQRSFVGRQVQQARVFGATDSSDLFVAVEGYGTFEGLIDRETFGDATLVTMGLYAPWQ